MNDFIEFCRTYPLFIVLACICCLGFIILLIFPPNKFIQKFSPTTLRWAEDIWFIPDDKVVAKTLVRSCALHRVRFDPDAKSILCFSDRSLYISRFSISGILHLRNSLPRNLGRKIYVRFDHERGKFVNEHNSHEEIETADFVILEEDGGIEAYFLREEAG